MALPTWKCENCSKPFTVGEFVCIDGQSNHVVPIKEYLLNDAPSDPGHPAPGGGLTMDSLRDGRTRICNIPPDRQVVVNGELKTMPGGYVEFIRGRFSTSDPEIQYYLDKKGGFCTPEQWEVAWLSDRQRLDIEKMKLTALAQRLENDRNDLLAQTKQKVGARA